MSKWMKRQDAEKRRRDVTQCLANMQIEKFDQSGKIDAIFAKKQG